MDDFDPISQLIQNLESPDDSIREETIEELSYFIDNERAIEALVSCLEDKNRLNQDLAASILSREENPYVVQYTIPYLQHKDFYIRNSAIKIIKQIGREFIYIIMEKLNQCEESYKLFLIEILNVFKDHDTSVQLMEYLDDPDPNIIYVVIEGIASTKTHEAVPKLIDLAKNSPESALRIAAINALGKIGDNSCYSDVMLFMEDEDPMVVFTTIDALGLLGTTKPVEKLYELYQDTFPVLQEMIIISIIRIDKKNNTDFLAKFQKEEVQKQLLNALDEEDVQLKQYALEEFKNYFNEDVFNRIINFLANEELEDKVSTILIYNRNIAFPLIEKQIRDPKTPPETIKIFIRILVEGAHDNITLVLEEFHQSPDQEIRVEIAHAIGKLQIKSLDYILEEYLKDGVGDVRKAAANAIGWGLITELIDNVFELLYDPYPDVLEAAVGALIVNANEKIITKFVELLNSEAEQTKLIAIKGLSWIGVQEVIPVLEETLESPQKELRKIAIESLARMNSKSSAKYIINRLQDSDAQNRQTAITALVTLNEKEAFNHILKLINDKNMWVRYIASKNLLFFGGEHALKYIKQILSGDDELSILGVLQTIGNYKNEELIPYFQMLTNSNNNDIKITAIQLLEYYNERDTK